MKPGGLGMSASLGFVMGGDSRSRTHFGGGGGGAEDIVFVLLSLEGRDVDSRLDRIVLEVYQADEVVWGYRLGR